MSNLSKMGFVKEKLKMNKIINKKIKIKIYIFFNFNNQKQITCTCMSCDHLSNMYSCNQYKK